MTEDGNEKPTAAEAVEAEGAAEPVGAPGTGGTPGAEGANGDTAVDATAVADVTAAADGTGADAGLASVPPASVPGEAEADGEAEAVDGAGGGGRRRVRRALLTALSVVLVLGAVGGTAAYTVRTVDRADRTVPTVLWDDDAAKAAEKAAEKSGAAKDPAGRPDRGRSDTELSRLLLPVPDGSRLGPDNGEDGNDGEISGKRATATMKEVGRGLAGKDRRAFDRAVDKLKVQGLAQRSFASVVGDQVTAIQLVKMKDKGAVRRIWSQQTGLMDSLGVLRDGPKIKDHKNVRCYRMPKGDEGLDSVICLAYEADLYLTVTVDGTEPFDLTAVRTTVGDQLDHIASPGEYI
ncbi:hypothetical protein [uncultured Streptomyces sp.]|uniref:hypothetical protein n=1 Tax=uncultured Streptomyces sp. TaxID=174707 RepID=UPI002616A4D9|nr:hypothetical protein [uncultured Streptomyces sp.]